jgi:hypothetical protein
MLKILMTLFGIEYFFASGIVNYILKKTNLAINEDLKETITDRVHRLRLDTKLLIQFMWFLTIFIGIPYQFKIWDLQIQLWVEKFFNPIFQFLAFCQGFVEGTAFGLLIAIAFWIAANWMLNQRAKLSIYYLLYRCRAIE